MKLILIICALVNVPFLFGQEAVVLESGLKEKLPYSDLKYSVCYDQFGDGFSRLEGTKLQYFSSDLKKVWEKELELVDGIGKYNWFITNNNGEEMIIAQYGTAYKVDNIDARLIKVNTEGNIKFIDLGEVFNFRGVGGYEFFEDGFMMHAIEAKGTVTPYGNTLKFYTHVLHFNYDLELVGEIITLPAFTEDEKFNFIWVYDGMIDGNYNFVTTYYLKGNQPSESEEKEGQEKRNLVIDKNGKLVSETTSALSAPFIAGTSKMIFSPIKYDRNRYNVILEGAELEPLRFFNIMTSFENIVVEKDGEKSKNLVTEFYTLVSPKTLENKKITPALQLTDVVEDKINDNLVLIFHSTASYLYYVAILDDDLSIASITSYASYDVGTSAKFAEREFFLYCGDKREEFGQLPSGYKSNPFTKMNEGGKESMHTILNYPGYQLLITDCFDTKTTTAIKFEY
jgi:hypothetical protein